MSEGSTRRPSVRPRKRLGQHFLRDGNIIRKIVSQVTPPPGAQVVEIGPGVGALTGLLLERFPDLIAIEVDERSVAELIVAYPSLDVRHADVLTVDWRTFVADGRALYVVGNLPYNITTPILFSLIDDAPGVVEAVLMMQLEVAKRLVAKPRTKDYGILSVATQLAATPTLLFKVSRNVFEPKPAVESALVRISFNRRPEPQPDEVDSRFVRKVIRQAFNQRRKTLRNSVAVLIPADRALPERWSASRAEELEPREFVELARFLTP
jgi:16S rRNA (adenine1518-N6/adenine1519-N6)-dimethyltransferase